MRPGIRRGRARPKCVSSRSTETPCIYERCRARTHRPAGKAPPISSGPRSNRRRCRLFDPPSGGVGSGGAAVQKSRFLKHGRPIDPAFPLHKSNAKVRPLRYYAGAKLKNFDEAPFARISGTFERSRRPLSTLSRHSSGCSLQSNWLGREISGRRIPHALRRLTSARRAAPSLLSDRRCRSPR